MLKASFTKPTFRDKMCDTYKGMIEEVLNRFSDNKIDDIDRLEEELFHAVEYLNSKYKTYIFAYLKVKCIKYEGNYVTMFIPDEEIPDCVQVLH